MISQCMNPDCRKELHYLRAGRVVRTTNRIDNTIKVEHFWLCGDCLPNYDFLFAKDGRVTVTARPKYVAVAAKPERALLLVS
jgi:hypothetical protein